MQQNSDALLDRSLGFGTENCVIVVTDRVRNDGKRESWPPRYLSHYLGRLHEAIRNDRGGSDTGMLGGHGVVQTTRRAATSIAHGCDNHVTALHVCQYFGRELAIGWKRRPVIPGPLGLQKFVLLFCLFSYLFNHSSPAT